jgi:sodium/potassium-transporting ATPase subunit alpha
MASNEVRRSSPMSQEIDRFVHIIASVAAVVAIIFFIVALTVNKITVGAAINFAIGTFISFVPEGLPATVTVLLTLAAKKMATRNVLVKDLQGVETLGAITLLATDKTGTLTRNQMTVTYIWTGLKMFFAQSQSATEYLIASELDVNNEGTLF